MEQKYRELLEKSFLNAENGISKINDDILYIEGMSGIKTRHFYNNLLDTDDARYLEIGTWKGSTVCSAMYKNKAKVLCIDNWSEFGGPKDIFLNNFEKFKGENDAYFIENNCFHINISELPIPKFNIYLYDGNHESNSHHNALIHYYDALDDIFIYIVDDWNCPKVRNGTISSIKHLNLNILYNKMIRTSYDDQHANFYIARKTWWNGIYVAILQKPKNV